MKTYTDSVLEPSVITYVSVI